MTNEEFLPAPQTPKKVLETMGCITRGKMGKPVVMEVVGENGQKVHDYISRPDRPARQHFLVEKCSI